MKEAENNFKIPQHEIEALARTLYPEMIKFFQSPEGIKEYEDWKKSQNQVTK